MSKLDPIVLKKTAIVLAILAMTTIIAAAVIGYVRKGEINLILILPFFAILASSFLIYNGAKKKADQ